MRLAQWMCIWIGLALAAGQASAQQYPSKPVSIVVGLAPGGTVDTVARLLAKQLEKKWGQPVVVENKPGAGGALALRELASKPADGYTLVVGATPSQLLWIKDTGFKYDDLKVVSIIGASYYCVMVNNELGAKTLADFIKIGKEQPERLAIGMIPSSAHEMTARQLQDVLQIGGTLVPYKGIGQMFPDLIAGAVQSTLIGYAPPLETGKVSALAVAGDKRWDRLPDVPTFKELGYDFNPSAPFTLYVRAGTPDEIANTLNEEAARLSQSAEFADGATKTFGITPLGLGIRESQSFMDKEFQTMRKQVEALGIKPE